MERLALPVLQVLPGWDDPDNARAGSDLPDLLALLDRRQAASPFPAGFPGGGVLGRFAWDRRNPVASRGFPGEPGRREPPGAGSGHGSGRLHWFHWTQALLALLASLALLAILVILERRDAGDTGDTG